MPGKGLERFQKAKGLIEENTGVRVELEKLRTQQLGEVLNVYDMEEISRIIYSFKFVHAFKDVIVNLGRDEYSDISIYGIPVHQEKQGDFRYGIALSQKGLVVFREQTQSDTISTSSVRRVNKDGWKSCYFITEGDVFSYMEPLALDILLDQGINKLAEAIEAKFMPTVSKQNTK